MGTYLTAQGPTIDTPSSSGGGKNSRRDWSLRQTPVVDAVRRVRDCVVNIHSERTARNPMLGDECSPGSVQSRVNA